MNIMKTSITLLLCAALAALPFQSYAPEPEPEPDVEAQSLLFGVVLVGVAVVIVGTAAYVVHKCDQRAKAGEQCPGCGQRNRKTDEACRSCGVVLRCADCDTKLARGATKCPACETPVPPPQRTLSRLQTSPDGRTWTDALAANELRFFPELEMLRFSNEAAFGQWLAGEEVVSVTQIATQQQAFFRLASD